MMSQAASEMRKERIERLLNELRYEVTRGIMEREIEEHVTFQFIIPTSATFKNGVVFCEFHTRPSQQYSEPFLTEPRLRVIR